MNLLELSDSPTTARLGWTIIHATWQIAAITALYAAASLGLRRATANARYLLGCSTLAAMVGLPLATFVWIGTDLPQPLVKNWSPGNPVLTDSIVESVAAPVDSEPSTMSGASSSEGSFTVQSLLPWLCGAWLAGVMLFSLRPLLGLVTVSRLRHRGLSPLSPELSKLAHDLVARLQIRSSVEFAQSTLVQVPTVLGSLRPIVLLPISALTGLTTNQLELLLAHELAHVRRYDYLLNILQTGIETVLFYHPCVWWVSTQVRAERENCCDDVAVQLCGNRATYIRTLMAMEEQRGATALVLAASGGSLLKRVRRLVVPGQVETRQQRAIAWSAGLLSMGFVALLLTLGPALAVNGRTLMAEPAAQADPVKPPTTAKEKPEPAGLPATTASDNPNTAANPYELALKITLEDDARVPLKITLFDKYHRADKTWENVAPGDVRLELPKREPSNGLLEITAQGYAIDRVPVTFSNDGVRAQDETVLLYRRRYAVLRYVVNLQGARTLTGDFIKKGRVAISYGSVPDLHGDWLIRQNFGDLEFSYHRYGANGFAQSPDDVPFDEITELPQPDQYKAQSVVAEKGAILLNRIEGNGPGDRRYAKILVEEITETPPKGVQVIDTMLPPSRVRAPRLARNNTADDAKSSGEFIATVHLEDNAQAPVSLELHNRTRVLLKTWKGQQPGEIRLKLPELEHDRYQLVAKAKGYASVSLEIAVSDSGVTAAETRFELYRQRYLIVRYAINSKGNRNLTGADVQTGRVAVVFGGLPGLVDWTVDQSEGKVKADIRRYSNHAGFAPTPGGTTFDQLETAPPPEDYSSTELVFEKGTFVCNRVLGHEPKTARYAKLFVEDITETPPKDVPIIDSRRN